MTLPIFGAGASRSEPPPPVFESDGNAREHRSRTHGNTVPVLFIQQERRLCFNFHTLYANIKTTPIMHQNSPLPDRK